MGRQLSDSLGCRHFSETLAESTDILKSKLDQQVSPETFLPFRVMIHWKHEGGVMTSSMPFTLIQFTLHFFMLEELYMLQALLGEPVLGQLFPMRRRQRSMSCTRPEPLPDVLPAFAPVSQTEHPSSPFPFIQPWRQQAEQGSPAPGTARPDETLELCFLTLELLRGPSKGGNIPMSDVLIYSHVFFQRVAMTSLFPLWDVWTSNSRMLDVHPSHWWRHARAHSLSTQRRRSPHPGWTWTRITGAQTRSSLLRSLLKTVKSGNKSFISSSEDRLMCAGSQSNW